MRKRHDTVAGAEDRGLVSSHPKIGLSPLERRREGGLSGGLSVQKWWKEIIQ